MLTTGEKYLIMYRGKETAFHKNSHELIITFSNLIRMEHPYHKIISKYT